MSPDEPDGRRLPLSVVVIAENEEDRIRACIESVLEACRRAVPAFEVVLVDSASTDRTVDIASEYPIGVYRIPREHVVSCGAGRYVGDRLVTGKLVLHVDGDMILTETWLAQAVEYLRAHEDVAAVEGELNESTQTEVEAVDKVGGVMLYDADALQSVGGFDPHLLGYEDVDVGYRLSVAGHRLVRLPTVSADHPPGGAFSEPVRRWRAGYYLAPGQVIRKSLSSPGVLAKLLARQRYKFALLGWLVAGTASLATAATAVAWLVVSMAGVAYVVSRLGTSGAFRFFSGKTLGLLGLVRGVALHSRPPTSFPTDAVEVVAEQSVVEGDARAASR